VLYSYHERVELSLCVLDSLLENCSFNKDKFRKSTVLLEKYLGDANSPFRNEQLYDKVLESEITSKWYDDLEKSVKRSRLVLIRQNRVGRRASDFIFVTPKGDSNRLVNIRANRLLLLFYNPECEACNEMKAALRSSRAITSEVDKGNLKVLAVYVDKDEQTWRRHLRENPAAWIEGRDYDEFLYVHNIYDLHAIPTVYLLDQDKIVILKDCMSIPEIENRLSAGETADSSK